MDVETFIKKWWSEANLDYRSDLREWMQKSYIEPIAFWESLYSQHESPTVVFEKYDFYTDCIVRHLGKDLIALKVMNEAGEVEAWTYDQIDAFVDVQVTYWTQNHKLQPGKTVALLLPYGLHFIVALMTAFRLGLLVSILPLKDRFFGRGQLERALEELKPDLIATINKSQISESWATVEIDLSLEKTFSSPLESHAYLANEMIQKHYDGTLIEATRSYLLSLRDGLIALHLAPSSCWARPFLSMIQEEPCCTLMALLAGATIFHVPDDYLTSHPKALEKEAIDIVGVSHPLQQLWIKSPGAPTKVKLWHRNPLFGNDHSWKAFSELNHLEKIPTSQLLVDRKKGGITLFSQPKTLEHVTFLHPSLGSPWKLLKLGKKGGLATEGYGLFHVEPEDDPHLVIAQVGDEWCVSMTTHPLKEGYRYPIQLVEETVKKLDFIQACMLVPERHPQHFISSQFMLLVFISPKEHHLISQKMEDWTRQIQDLIQSEVGEAFIPDKCLFFAMYPKFEKGGLNRIWVENQYRNGTLFQKQNRSIYNLLNLVRQSIYEKT